MTQIPGQVAPIRVRATEIGEYIRHRSCERRFKLEINNRELAMELPFAERLFNPLDPVLQEMGRRKEEEWAASLIQAGLVALPYSQLPPGQNDQRTNWTDFINQLHALAPGQNAYAREVCVSGDIGVFHIEGRIDFVLVLWEENTPKLRIVECKASRKDRTYHRVQVALYHLLLQNLLQQPLQVANASAGIEQVECLVARIDEITSEIQPILSLPPLNLEMEESDIRQLLSAEGALARIVRSDLSALEYQLDEKCDGCVFNVHCFPESSRERRLELLSLEPSVVRILRDAGITTIDELAELDLAGAQAQAVRENPAFSQNLERLHAKARSRRRTLPEGDVDPESYEVNSLPLANGQTSQLPVHEQEGFRLVRVYLSVYYDYTENRIGGLAAHVTTSSSQIHTGFIEEGGQWRPDPEVKEIREIGRDANNRRQFQDHPLNGTDVVEFKRTPWSSVYADDTNEERSLIGNFFTRLVEVIADVAQADRAPVHFYVWSRSDIAQLIEACSRADTRLLRHFQELLGCRQGLEQLIYSCLQNEVDYRYALGWTGRGLPVVTSLSWFGRRFHWVRQIEGEEVRLDQKFTQDIFDFKTDLELQSPTEWARPGQDNGFRHKIEIRSRFFDSLSAPYWRAHWQTLPNPDADGTPQLVANAIRRYNQTSNPLYLPAFLQARTHALRWVEERITFKNSEIQKPLLTISELRNFSLGVNNAAMAALDFLRLDQHVKVNDWIAQNLNPTADRIATGRMIPVRNVTSQRNNELSAEIYLEPYGIRLDALEAICSFGQNSFVRLSVCSDNPQRGQTINQLIRASATCTIQNINWQTGIVRLSVIPTQSDNSSQYILQSINPRDGFDYATIDESVSDFVAVRVDDRLESGLGNFVYQWFDVQQPLVPEQAPLPDDVYQGYSSLLGTVMLGGYALARDQQQAILQGLNAKIQFLQGPPGTGKTTTTAAAILMRILAQHAAGNIILVAANTHTAVDTLLQRINTFLQEFINQTGSAGHQMPMVRLAKVHSSNIEPSATGIEDLLANSCVRRINNLRQNSVVVIGGTTSALLKMEQKLSESQAFSNNLHRFQVSTLIVDEASMMVFPHFLALATLVREDGQIMLAGDNRQLSPIIAHDWQNEDRPPVVLYQPYVSAYDAVLNIARLPNILSSQVQRSTLSFTFRLPSVIRNLIARLYRLDDIELQGSAEHINEAQIQDQNDNRSLWQQVWDGESGLYLILHSERQSKQRNELELAIVERLLQANDELPADSVAIITPHRAQRSLLQSRLANDDAVSVIDTVERLQGGERPTVIVSATASDPSAISMRAEFILSLNRSNVAFSRAKQRLIVVCSESLLNYIPSEIEHYEAAMLWKSLRVTCSQVIATHNLEGHVVHGFTPGGLE
jgi:hypothetical protein